jgi:hypothetical protein
MKYILFFLLVFFFVKNSFAQEFECDVTVDMHQLSERFRENLQDFERNLEEYINSYRWSGNDWDNDKISCSMSIVFVTSDENFRYQANVFWGTQRKIYKSPKNSIEARIADDKWQFVFTRNQRLDHNEFRFDEVASFVDFYMYLLLGVDFDTYEKLSGTKYYRKAMNISTMTTGTSSNGWEATSGGNYNRVQLVNELLNSAYAPLRNAIYEYHYNGLDLLAEKPREAKATILSSLEAIAKLRKKLNTRSYSIKFFFDTKYLEIADTFLPSNDAEIFTRLSVYDPSHQKTYDEYKGKIK